MRAGRPLAPLSAPGPHRFTLLDTGPVRHVLRSASLGAETGIRMRLDERRAPLRASESTAHSMN